MRCRRCSLHTSPLCVVPSPQTLLVRLTLYVHVTRSAADLRSRHRSVPVRLPVCRQSTRPAQVALDDRQRLKHNAKSNQQLLGVCVAYLFSLTQLTGSMVALLLAMADASVPVLKDDIPPELFKKLQPGKITGFLCLGDVGLFLVFKLKRICTDIRRVWGPDDTEQDLPNQLVRCTTVHCLVLSCAFASWQLR